MEKTGIKTGLSIETIKLPLKSSVKNTREVTCMNVTIAGNPTLSEVLTLMKSIRSVADEIPGDYVSITDLSHLEISKFVRRIILLGVELAYKGLLAVKHQSFISFVLFNKNQAGATSIIAALNRINDEQLKKQNYSYVYKFITHKNEVITEIEQWFAAHSDTQKNSK